MVKVKNKKSSNADAISAKRESLKKKTLNPFEVHINNEKLKVLGRKLKNDRGLPGVSRAKALAKRKHTLLPEYKLQHKANQFHDKRIGERNRGLTAEDKSMARYTAVRVNQHSKRSIFNLADDEVLTHRGQTLSEIEKFDDPRSDDEDDVEDSGNLDSKFVGGVHFGGGMLKKADGAKSHKDLINQLIVESKKRKVEMQQQKEATSVLTEKLDSEWKDLLPLVNKKLKTDDVDNDAAKAKVDDYDKVMRELKFEARGTPSDKLKTEDEIAREDKEKLERLERERLDRMRGVVDEPRAIKHRSADDLDDNFAYDDIEPEDDVTLSYNNEGKSNVQFDIQIDDKDNKTEANGVSDEENKGDDEEDAVEEEESEVETDDDLSDLKESDSESDEEVEQEAEEEETKPKTKAKSGILKKPVETVIEEEPKTQEEIKQDLLRRKEIMEQARIELPYTFSLPVDYDALVASFDKQSPEHQGIIIERMIKCNHPSLKEGNKESLGMLFVYLLQHLNDLCSDIVDDESLRTVFKVFANLTPHLFDLAQLNPENAASSLIEVIKEKQNDFRGKKAYPGVDVLIYLKLISCLFSTSDFRHHVVNPCMLFIEQLLTKSRVKTKRDVAYGLFVVCLVLEYTTLSKRYLPAAVTFLNGILHMAIPKTVRILKVTTPFKSQCSMLVIQESHTDNQQLGKMDITDLLRCSHRNEDINDDFKHSTLDVTISLLRKFYLHFQDHPSCCEIFETTLDFLQQLPLDCCSKTLTIQINNFIGSIEEFKGNRKLEYLQMQKQKPKALRLYEPNIEKVYDFKKHKVQSREKAERDKLIYKLKKEQKGAIREIRRDKSYLGRVKLNQKLQSDAERRDKVKRIYSEASMQQSELNALDRSNNRKKKK